MAALLGFRKLCREKNDLRGETYKASLQFLWLGVGCTHAPSCSMLASEHLKSATAERQFRSKDLHQRRPILENRFSITENRFSLMQIFTLKSALGDSEI